MCNCHASLAHNFHSNRMAGPERNLCLLSNVLGDLNSFKYFETSSNFHSVKNCAILVGLEAKLIRETLKYFEMTFEFRGLYAT